MTLTTRIDPLQTTRIEPLQAPLCGAIRVPGDKSISHRAVLLAAMAEGTSQLKGVLDCADVRSTIEAVRALGAEVRLDVQDDGSLAGQVTGWGSTGPCAVHGNRASDTVAPEAMDATDFQTNVPFCIDCGNSGTTARLLMGVLAPWPVTVELTGDESLCRRPMGRVCKPLSQMGVSIDASEDETLPVRITGTDAIRALRYESPLASAQVKSAVLLAGVRAQGTTSVHEPAVSRRHTEHMLPCFGVDVSAEQRAVTLAGPQVLQAASLDVPGDPSIAAVYACAAALTPGSDIEIPRICAQLARIGFVNVLRRMGVTVEFSELHLLGSEVCGTLQVRSIGSLQGIEVPAEDIGSMIDEIPVLSVVAAFANGTSIFRGVGELRVKESDRLTAIIGCLTQIGIHAWVEGDDLYIEGCPEATVPGDLIVDPLGDHRLVMMWSILALTRGVALSIVDFDAIEISYPNFLDDIRRISS